MGDRHIRRMAYTQDGVQDMSTGMPKAISQFAPEEIFARRCRCRPRMSTAVDELWRNERMFLGPRSDGLVGLYTLVSYGMAYPRLLDAAVKYA